MAVRRPGDAATEAARHTFEGLADTELVTVSIRIPQAVREKIAGEASRRGLRVSQLLRVWIMERLERG